MVGGHMDYSKALRADWQWREWYGGQRVRDRPFIGITVDISEVGGGAGDSKASPRASDPPRLRLDCGAAYADAVTRAGGLPVLLVPDVVHAGACAGLCDGFVLTGGGDPRMEPFGEVTHAAAEPMHERRQAFEVALLRALERDWPHKPVLGICLGMQMMALLAGGRLNQHLPDTLPTAARHRNAAAVGAMTVAGARACHAILVDRVAAAAARVEWLAGHAENSMVDSHHHQAMESAGALSVVARSDDGVIEAVAASTRPFYLGVQWHPERTTCEVLGAQLFQRLVQSARG